VGENHTIMFASEMLSDAVTESCLKRRCVLCFHRTVWAVSGFLLPALSLHAHFATQMGLSSLTSFHHDEEKRGNSIFKLPHCFLSDQWILRTTLPQHSRALFYRKGRHSRYYSMPLSQRQLW